MVYEFNEGADKSRPELLQFFRDINYTLKPEANDNRQLFLCTLNGVRRAFTEMDQTMLFTAVSHNLYIVNECAKNYASIYTLFANDMTRLFNYANDNRVRIVDSTQDEFMKFRDECLVIVEHLTTHVNGLID